MRKLTKLAALCISAAVLMFFVACSDGSENGSASGTSDIMAPASVTNLAAESKDSRVLLTWTDAKDSDVLFYEVSHSGSGAINRALSFNKSCLYVAQGAGGCYVSGLTNDTEYTFNVVTVDINGNRSAKASVNATPSIPEEEILTIDLSADVPNENGYSGNKTCTSLTVTAKINTDYTVKKVTYQKDGSLNANTLIKYGAEAEMTGNDDKTWTFTIEGNSESVNGSYTVAALDIAGREEIEVITIDQFDFTGPSPVSDYEIAYDSDEETMTLTWTDPTDEDFSHVEIYYVSCDGSTVTDPSESVIVKKGVNTLTFTDIDASN
ncbi:MAG: fibronectin type III domain-containing protein, partial [Treponema sp.]|nr:fibronectin type III domain-containing protein [Treponema sp.]